MFKQAIGVTPAQEAEAYQLNRWQKNREITIIDKRKDILKGYGKAVRDKDAEGKADARDKVRDFQQALPIQCHHGQGIVQSLRSQQQARGRSISGVNLNPKLRPYISSRTPHHPSTGMTIGAQKSLPKREFHYQYVRHVTELPIGRHVVILV